MQDIIIAIDGYSGCGKSSTAKEVARALHYTYLDSGAMYRAVTLFFIRQQVNLHDKSSVLDALDKINIQFHRSEDGTFNETYLNGENVEKEIRKMEVSERVSAVSAIPEVRNKMVEQQRKLGASKKVVMDGRDIGSQVFPHADLKIFMTADLKVRALRRKEELEEKGNRVTLDEIMLNLSERDRIDSQRQQSPLVKVDDAVEIDTTNLDFSDQVRQVLSLAKKHIEV
jgi:cytidylate kinase